MSNFEPLKISVKPLVFWLYILSILYLKLIKLKNEFLPRSLYAIFIFFVLVLFEKARFQQLFYFFVPFFHLLTLLKQLFPLWHWFFFV